MLQENQQRASQFFLHVSEEDVYSVHHLCLKRVEGGLAIPDLCRERSHCGLACASDDGASKLRLLVMLFVSAKRQRVWLES
jgi:hypothetical protein